MGMASAPGNIVAALGRGIHMVRTYIHTFTRVHTPVCLLTPQEISLGYSAAAYAHTDIDVAADRQTHRDTRCRGRRTNKHSAETHALTHARAHTSPHTNFCVFGMAQDSAGDYICTCMRIHVHIFNTDSFYMQIHTHTHVYIYLYVYVHVYIYTYTYIYTYINGQDSAGNSDSFYKVQLLKIQLSIQHTR
jgi:hypothetical protein